MMLLPSLNAKSKRVVFLALFLTGFFDLVVFRFVPGFHYIVSYCLLLVLLLYKQKDFRYNKYIYLYLFFFLISCIYSHLYNGQFLFKTLGFSRVYIGLCFSFYILKSGLSSKDIMKCLIFISILYCMAYIIQWIVYPLPLFSGANDEGDSSNVYRVRIAGSMCAYTLFLYGFNMFLHKKKAKFLVYSALAFTPIIIMGFRTLVALSILCVCAMVVVIEKKFFKCVRYFMVLAIMALVAFQTNIVQDKITEMRERQENSQTFDNPDYIRLRQYVYFTTVFFVKPWEQVIGGGVPAGTTKYAQTLAYEEETYGYYWVDWGLIGLTWIIGIPAVLLLISMYLHCAWRCKDPQLQFVRFTLVLLVIGSLATTKELYRSGNILLASFLFCYEYLYYKEKQQVRSLT